MKEKKQVKQTYRFQSAESSESFLSGILQKEQCEQTEDGFKLFLKSYHGAMEYFVATVETDEIGCRITGTMQTFYPGDEKKKSRLRRVWDTFISVLLATLLFPLILVCALCGLIVEGITTLVAKKKGNYQKELTDEEILIKVMTGEMGCQRLE